MTQRNKFIKWVCETLAIVIGWFIWYIILSILSVLLGLNPMNETLTCMALVLLCLCKVDRLEKKVDGE